MAENKTLKGKDILQKWQKDFENFYDVYSTFIIDGFIDDLQPYVEDLEGEVDQINVENLDICEYFKKIFENKEYHGKRNLLVIYDPTESVDRRFDIREEYTEIEPEENSEESTDNNSPYGNRLYNSQLASHFYEILKSEDVDKQLIDHSYNGVSPDFAKIHYTLSEKSRIKSSESVFGDFYGMLEELFSQGDSFQPSNYIFVIKMISRLKSGSDSKNLSQDELEIFRQLLTVTKCLSETESDNKLIILADNDSDLPTWIANGSQNYNIKNLYITKPSDDYKQYFFNKLVNERAFGDTFDSQYQEQCVPQFNDTPEARDVKLEAGKRVFKKFNAYSTDFSMRQLAYYEKYLENENNKVADLDKIGFSLSNFKNGDLENPWDDESKIVEILDIKSKLQRKLKGQDPALENIQQILKRAVIGLDKIDNPDAPRIILFLAGPTGTGKTEVCKQIAEVVFGSADRIIRFDMSEYGADESDQKLFGAPPGYVGYEEGGKLTNAIIKEPFSLVLFDEIEKAHNSILDKFLQILSDGRLTSGKGETVSFSDSIIVITSNAGVSSDRVQGIDEEKEKELMGVDRPTVMINMAEVEQMERAGMTDEEIYKEVSNFLSYFVKYYFVCKLGRPELYGRIEDSIVYYNYIGREAVKLICKAKIKSFNKALRDRYGCNVNLEVLEDENPVLQALIRYCQTSDVRSMGARGIGKAMNSVFNGSLSHYISTFVVEQRKNELVGRTLKCSLTDEYIAILNEELEMENVEIVMDGAESTTRRFTKMNQSHIQWSAE